MQSFNNLILEAMLARWLSLSYSSAVYQGLDSMQGERDSGEDIYHPLLKSPVWLQQTSLTHIFYWWEHFTWLFLKTRHPRHIVLTEKHPPPKLILWKGAKHFCPHQVSTCLNMKTVWCLIPCGTSKCYEIIYSNLRYIENWSNIFIREKVVLQWYIHYQRPHQMW